MSNDLYDLNSYVRALSNYSNLHIRFFLQFPIAHSEQGGIAVYC